MLDFGCGWGRLTRLLARDVAAGAAVRLRSRRRRSSTSAARPACPATLARSEFLPERLPFDEPFDLAFAFSVFTHLSEPAHERCLRALHAALRPGGVLVRHGAAAGATWSVARLAARCTIRPATPSEPSHPQYAGGEMTYGETVITLPYVRERWSELFELLDADILLGDLFQVC